MYHVNYGLCTGYRGSLRFSCTRNVILSWTRRSNVQLRNIGIRFRWNIHVRDDRRMRNPRRILIDFFSFTCDYFSCLNGRPLNKQVQHCARGFKKKTVGKYEQSFYKQVRYKYVLAPLVVFWHELCFVYAPRRLNNKVDTRLLALRVT